MPSYAYVLAFEFPARAKQAGQLQVMLDKDVLTSP